jgi:hypothetical protein
MQFAASLLHCRMNYSVFLVKLHILFRLLPLTSPPSPPVVGLLRDPKLAARFTYRASLA